MKKNKCSCLHEGVWQGSQRVGQMLANMKRVWLALHLPPPSFLVGLSLLLDAGLGLFVVGQALAVQLSAPLHALPLGQGRAPLLGFAAGPLAGWLSLLHLLLLPFVVLVVVVAGNAPGQVCGTQKVAQVVGAAHVHEGPPRLQGPVHLALARVVEAVGQVRMGVVH